MRATAKTFIVGVSCAALTAASTLWAGPLPVATTFLMESAAIGQLDEGGQSEQRREADRWLREARQAMKDGEFDAAEQFIRRAEQTNVRYDALFARFVDTPAKARHDLDRMRADRKSSSFQPPADPYGAAAQAGNAEVSEPRVSRFPSADEPADVAAPAADRNSSFSGASLPPSSVSSGTGVGDGSRRLLEARRALARGDLRAAVELTAQARSLNENYPLHADSPTKVEALLQRAQQFSSTSPAQASDPAFARSQAQFLMDQAEGMLQYNEFEQARQIAERAQQLPAQYQPFERTPDQLLQRIASQRKAQGGPVAEATEPTAFPGDPVDGPVATPLHPLKAEVLRLLATAQAALDRGDLSEAKFLAEEAQSIPVPDSAYAAEEPRPWQLMLKINQAMTRRSPVVAAAGTEETSPVGSFPVQQGLYDPTTDHSQVVPAQSQQEAVAPSRLPTPTAAPLSEGDRLYELGLRALEQRDRDTALRHFTQAWQYEQDLDPLVRQQLKDKLTLLRQAATAPAASDESSRLEAVDAKQQLVRQKIYREITSEQAEAERMASTDPKGAMERLQKLRDRVRESEVEPAAQKQMLTLVDRSIDDLQQYIEQNRADIELNEQNAAVREEIDRGRMQEADIQNEIARLVEQFEQLLDERRYAEAEVIAKQAHELDPQNPTVQNLVWKSHFVRGFQEQFSIGEAKEDGFLRAMNNVDRASEPFDDSNPLVFDIKRWKELTPYRRKMMERENNRLSPAELEIQQSLQTHVDVDFQEQPLAEVMQMLGAVAGVNVYLDPQGLAAEGVTSDTPVTIRLSEPISLRSALSLILEPLHLSYVIQHEVLRVTSEQTRDADVYVRTYNVADLVIPIPNFAPGYNVGLPGALREAHNAIGYGGGPAGPSGMGPLTVAANEGSPAAAANASVLAQMGASGMLNGLGSRPQPAGSGPGGMASGGQAEFDHLIELITTTISPQSWDEVGGPGSVREFHTNLSLVISQTQEVHEEIADLLDQLRRLQDLQVTIEVRFITLSDNFFERIGVDFDFDIDDNVNLSQTQLAQLDDQGPSVTIGLDRLGNPTADLDLSFEQDSFTPTVPTIAGFDPQSAANFGFAILSDIEVFFLLSAAQGDQRSNVLQAPKITLFNGQLSSVSDVSQRPFVTSVIPVVGDFAAAHQPVIVVLSEGTSLSVQAVVSSDRRFVRLTLVPFFSSIGNVETFQFHGKTTSDTGTNIVDPDGKPTGVDNAVTSREGTTVQLPTFSFTSVSTTVSVPDGGTILLGGIKRLTENRNERGVPILSKLPYINRLFKNVGISRTSTSLMMMVTPRIIIQEEEEERLFGIEPGL